MAHTILIVDDEKDLREALKTGLEQSGFTVSVTKNGVDGLTAAEAIKPDLILLDITMPVMNGHEMLNALRRTTWGKSIPVILLTNNDDPVNITQGIGLRGNEYLIKSHTSLRDIIKKIKQQLAGY